jgi:predicted acetyltransferase
MNGITMSKIRNLRPEEFEEAIRLSEYAFQYEQSDEERANRAASFDPKQHWGWFEDGRLAAKVSVLDFETWIHGRLFPMGGIAGVASWPEYRRQGMVGELLKNALRAMREQEKAISYLYPFSFAFYRKYGWEMAGSLKNYEIAREQLPSFPPPAGRIHRIEPDWKTLNPIFEAYASEYNGPIRRSEKWWNDTIFQSRKGPIVVYEDERREARGYMHYQVKERTFTVHEMVCLDGQARRAFWNFIRNHDSMITKVKLRAPEDDALAFLLPDPYIKQELSSSCMARIVDLAAFVRDYPFAATEAGASLVLNVRDENAPWNDGSFALTVDGDGRGTLTAVDSAQANASELALQCSIRGMTAMMLGNRRPRFLSAAGQLTGSPEAVDALERLLPARTAYLPDYF